jgi:hypothetical protein
VPNDIITREPRTRSLRDGGDRVARVARWLSRPPPAGAIDLRLYISVGEDTDLVQMWPIKVVSIELAPEIDDLIRMAAEECRQQIRAKTVWCGEGGQPLTTQSYVCNPENTATVLAELDGGSKSSAIQLQRHYEATSRMMLGTVDNVIGRFDQLTERAFAELARRDLEKERLIAENEELRRSLAGWEALAKDAAEQAEKAAEKADSITGSSRIDKYIEIFGPMLEKHLQQKTATVRANGTGNGSANGSSPS